MAQLGHGNALGGNNQLPPPGKFSGKMEHWEDWSWSVKSHVALFKTEAAEVMENVETVAAVIADERLEALEAENPQFFDTGLIRFSRQQHYLLAQMTTESARLVVRGNVELNGFETWRLLSRSFSLPRTALDIQVSPRPL